MNSFLRAALGALALSFAAVAPAADWPTRPVKLVVPSGPASSPDIFARLLTASLQQRTGQSFIVENKGGASGSLGIDNVAKAAPDGYTLGLAYPAPLTTNNLMMKKVPYDSKKDLQLITIAAVQPTVLVVGNHVAAKNFAEFAALMKKSPGKFNSGSTGVSSLGRLLAEATASNLGTSVENIVYNGAGPQMIALARGDVDFGYLPAAGAMSFIGSDKVKLFAVAADKRSALLPKTPTMKELGMPEVDGSNWLGIVAPAALPADVGAKIRQEIVDALNSPELKKALADNYMEPVGSTPAEFARVVDADTARWKPLVEKLKLSID